MKWNNVYDQGEICPIIDSFAELCDVNDRASVGLPGKGDLSCSLLDSVVRAVVTSGYGQPRLRIGRVDWPRAIARISDQDGDDVTRCSLGPDWWGNGQRSFYIVSQSLWRAQLGYVSTRDAARSTLYRLPRLASHVRDSAEKHSGPRHFRKETIVSRRVDYW